MPSNLEKNLKNVLDQFTPDILGVIWITNEELSRELFGFDEFNYLFDGLISQYLYGQELAHLGINSKRSNLFFTKNFNQNIFLIHLQIQNDISSLSEEHVTMIQKKKKILLLNKTPKNWGSDFQKHYPQFDFIKLEL